MVRAISFQFQRGSFYAPWYTFGLQWLQPFAQAAVLALLYAAVARMRADPSLRRDVVRLGALAAALLLGVQLSADYWTWSYLPWVFPFLAAALLISAGESHARPPRASGRARTPERSSATIPRERDHAVAATLARSTPMTFRRLCRAVKAKALVSSIE